MWAPEHHDGPLAPDEREHVRRAVALLVRRARERGYERVAVGAGEHIWAEIQRALPDELRPRVLGNFQVDAGEASPAEVRRRVEPLLRAAQARRERDALDRLPEHGVRGLTATVSALAERRVATLLLRPGLQRPGAICPRCELAFAQPTSCPADGSRTEPHPNVVEWAVRHAIDQDADVLAIRYHDDFRRDEIAALLRF